MPSAILALDQGTTSSRSIVFDHAGAILAVAQREFRQVYPQAGWVEHDPLEIWEAQIATARQALSAARLTAKDISALGIANQRETTVVWDRRTGLPIHNAIVWQDRRTAPFCDDLKRAGHAETVLSKTGLVIDAYFSASKLRWILDRVPGARERARRGELAFGTIDSWLLWNLTAGALHITDPSNASRTMLYRLRSGGWDDDMLRLLDVPGEVLPGIRSSRPPLSALPTSPASPRASGKTPRKSSGPGTPTVSSHRVCPPTRPAIGASAGPKPSAAPETGKIARASELPRPFSPISFPPCLRFDRPTCHRSRRCSEGPSSSRLRFPAPGRSTLLA